MSLGRKGVLLGLLLAGMGGMAWLGWNLAAWLGDRLMAGSTAPGPAVALPLPAAFTLTPSPTARPSPTATLTAPPTATATPRPSPTPSPEPTATLPPIPDGGSLVIGYSVEGRPLTVYRFGRGPWQRMILAGIHGGYEWNTVVLAETLIRLLQQGEITVPPEVTLFIVPNLNPDGYARHKGVLGRANARGVDLNRNFPWNWQPDWDRQGCWNYAPITAGAGPLSEPETRALAMFLQRPDVHPQALVSYHSAALGIFPAGWPYAPGPRSTQLAQDLAQVTGYRYPPLDYGCQLTGQLVDWTAFALGIPSVDVELSTHEDIDLRQNLAALRLLLTWRLPATPTATPSGP